jgi:hypothetical protein
VIRSVQKKTSPKVTGGRFKEKQLDPNANYIAARPGLDTDT